MHCGSAEYNRFDAARPRAFGRQILIEQHEKISDGPRHGRLAFDQIRIHLEFFLAVPHGMRDSLGLIGNAETKKPASAGFVVASSTSRLFPNFRRSIGILLAAISRCQ